jgi:hypothetical protein
MLKLASKFALDIFPSVIATILGAYIVNHYINAKPPADAAAAVSTADPKKAASKADSKPSERSADLGNVPEPGVRAKGISEKSISDKAVDKATFEKPADKADRPSETASIPPTTPDKGRHTPTPREKAASKPAPAPAAEPVVAAPVTVPPAESAVTPDANDLARAAIERLRGSEPSSRPKAVEPKVVEPKAIEPKSVEPKVVEPKVLEQPAIVAAPIAPNPPPVATAPSLQPLPPPILVSTPQVENKPAAVRANDPLHPTPPADIPDAAHQPLDLRADATDQPPAKRPSVADDVLSATKKLFNSVLPK